MNDRLLKDALLKITRALPNGAAAVTSDSIDTGVSSRGIQPNGVEFLLTAPALNATEMPDGKTMTYDLLGSDNADLSAPSVTMPRVIIQTGAGGVGAAGATHRYRPAANGPRYWGFKGTGSASGNATTASATFEATF